MQQHYPAIPSELKATIDGHMRLFRGWLMKAEDTDPKDKGATPEDGDENLGEGGKKALEAERAARRALEKRVAELDGTKATLDALKAALGPEASKDDPEVAVRAVTDKVEKLERQLLVERVAREHKITSADDIKLLGDLTSEEQVRSWAKRLAPGDSDEGDDKDKGNGGRRRPKADPSAGKGGEGSNSPKSIAELRAERRAAREPKTT